MRWHPIAKAIDFHGKRVIELGCNLGLLSIQAVLAGASAAVGADINAGVVEAARLAALAFGATTASFRTLNFDSDSRWEATLGDGDVVAALSISYWVKDKARFWRYLARFPEILFEGHESLSETLDNLAHHGFSCVRELGYTERHRMLFHAKSS
jgi:2-polyprenyl-3-methyl-5-hydroxy-6-metoxy-1,4-benzoquinol methylase